LIGARPSEVILADSTSVNLFKLAMAAVQARPGRTKIVTDELNFPSDVYLLEGVAQLSPGRRLEVVPSPDGLQLSADRLALALDEHTALVALSHTAFKSGFVYDLAEVTRLAHKVGALILWDLSHSAGVMPIGLGAAGADLAVGCTYKYLNGGPGAPAFMFVREDLQPTLANPITGWFSQTAPFDMALDYHPTGGMRRFLSGTPPVLSLLALEPGLDLLIEAGIERLRAKSMRQTAYLIDLWRSQLAPLGFRLNSPEDAERRGGHVSLGHDDALAIDQALIQEMRVLPDFRPPDSLRFGLSPLYTTFEEIHTAVGRLSDVVQHGTYRTYASARPQVT
jgi:kynureninase